MTLTLLSALVIRNKLVWRCLALCLALCSCSQKEAPTAEEQAAKVAKEYYDALIYGRPELWIDGHAGMEQQPDGYRQMLLENAQMFLDQQQRRHGGIAQVTVAKPRSQYIEGDPIAILNLCFADASQETIAVPMKLEDGEWKMK